MVKPTKPVDCPDPVDPLINYSGLSLFPNFSSSSSLPPNPSSDDWRSHLKDMVLKSSDNLMNQAKAILDGSLNLTKSDKTTATVQEDQTEAMLTVTDEIPRERRPALGLKRAKFSAKPVPSQPDLSFEPSIDIDKLKDPEEFFAAFEKMENAKKEWQRQRGQPLIDLDQNRAALAPRSRRPSLFGKSATYKHRSFSSTGFPDDDEVLLSSQEASNPSIVSPIREETIPETNVMEFSSQARVSDVKLAMDNIGSKLDELLSCSYEGLDEDGVQSLLQDKLNIKIRDIGKLSLRDLPGICRREYESSSEAVTSMKDNIYHGNGTSRAASNVSYQLINSSTNHHVSPTLPKSPLASISLLNRHISKLTPPKDPFSCIDMDSSPGTGSYLEKQNVKEADQIDKSLKLHESLKSPVQEETAGGFDSLVVPAENSAGLKNGSKERFVETGHSDLIVGSANFNEFRRSPACGEEHIAISGEKIPSPTQKDVASSGEPEELVNQLGPTTQVGGREDLFESARFPTHGEDNLAFPTSLPTEEDQVAEAQKSKQTEVLNENSAVEKLSSGSGNGEVSIAQAGARENLFESTSSPTSREDNLAEPTRASTEQEDQTLQPLKTVGSSKRRRETEVLAVPSQETAHVETVKNGTKGKAKSTAPVSKESMNKRRKEQSALPVTREVGERLRRLSLYEAGTKWEAGVRRSTRIRMRPLERWRGERFLYGRIHESMVSVIGVKYASPTKDAEEPGMKVKSFVSDKYKDVVNEAALH